MNDEEKEINELYEQTVKFVLEKFGEPCDTYAAGCPICEAWLAVKTLFEDLATDYDHS